VPDNGYCRCGWNIARLIGLDEAKEIPLYNSERSYNQLRFCHPPNDVPRLLWRAWIAVRPGVHNPHRRSTAKEIAHYLKTMCISDEASEWAAKKADQYYDDKIEFEEFVKAFRLGV
jgi:hypothetical protein